MSDVGAALLTEQTRLIEQITRTADAQRRSVAFTVQLIVSNLTFACAPTLARSKAIFGSFTTPIALSVILPTLGVTCLTVFVYRRSGGDSRAYRALDILESALLYVQVLCFIIWSEVHWSLLWALPPFSAIFWGLTKPFHVRLYVRLISVSHGLTVAVLIAGHRLLDAGIALGVGGLALAAYALVAQAKRNDVYVEADRNVVRNQLGERLLDEERQRVALSLASGVAKRLSGLVKALSEHPVARLAAAQQAQAALLELTSLPLAERADSLPSTVAQLAEALETKCRPLCLNVGYHQALTADPSAPLSPSTALAGLRIAQELVRNAVTHGAAKQVRVELRHHEGQLELSVRDDGVGLSAERFARATGGLHNAKRWSTEQGGSMHRKAGTGTELVVSMPAGATHERSFGPRSES